MELSGQPPARSGSGSPLVPLAPGKLVAAPLSVAPQAAAPLATAPPLAAALAPGQIMTARVLEVLGSDTFLLGVRGRTLVASSPLALTPDSMVQLEVQTAGEVDSPMLVKLLTSEPPPRAALSVEARVAQMIRDLGLPAGPAAELTVAAFTRLGVPLAESRPGAALVKTADPTAVPTAVLRQAVELVQATISAHADGRPPPPERASSNATSTTTSATGTLRPPLAHADHGGDSLPHTAISRETGLASRPIPTSLTSTPLSQPLLATRPSEVPLPSPTRTWSAGVLQQSVPTALPAAVATATAQVALSPLPLSPMTLQLALRAADVGLPTVAKLLTPAAARAVDLAHSPPAQAVRAALTLAGVFPPAISPHDTTLLHQLVRTAVLAGNALGSGAVATVDLENGVLEKGALENPNFKISEDDPDASVADHRLSAGRASAPDPGRLTAAQRGASAAPRAGATEDFTDSRPSSSTGPSSSPTAEAAMAAVREVAAQQLFPPVHLADYDRVLGLPLMVAGQPMAARLAVSTRRTADGRTACWLRVDCAMSRLGEVSVRMSGADGGPVAVTLVAAPAAAAELAAALPDLTADLHARGLVAALRVVSEEIVAGDP